MLVSHGIETRPFASWGLEDHAANFYRLTKGKLEQKDTCKGCTLGKYAKASFEDRDSRAGAILERVHSNVCRPFSTASTTKQRYYVIFIDDFSLRCCIYFMQKKDQTFLMFCELKPLGEKESGKK